jgi:hypothetical protein
MEGVFNMAKTALNTLEGLFELGFIQSQKVARVDPHGRIELIQDGTGWFSVGKFNQNENQYGIIVFDSRRYPTIETSTIQQYTVKRRESGEWTLAFLTKSGTIYNFDIGRNADFAAAEF